MGEEMSIVEVINVGCIGRHDYQYLTRIEFIPDFKVEVKQVHVYDFQSTYDFIKAKDKLRGEELK